MREIKFLSVFVLMLCLFSTTPVTPVYAGVVGDQPPEQYNFTGNVAAEKARENLMFQAIVIETGDPCPTNPFTNVEFQTGGLLGFFFNSELATWQTWPMGRWTFESTNPEDTGVLGTGIGANVMGDLITEIANIVFQITKVIVKITINIAILVFNTSLLGITAAWLGEGMKNIFGNQTELMWLLLTIGSISLVIYSVFQLLKGKMVSVLKATGIAVCAVALTLMFIANTQSIITKTAEVTDAVTGIPLGAIGSFTSQGNNILHSGTLANDPLNRGLIVFGQTAWRAIVANPWAATLFGTTKTENLYLTQEELDKIHMSYFPGKQPSTSTRIDTLILGTTGEAREHVVDVLVCPNTNHGAHPGTTSGLHSDGALSQLMTAFLTIIASLALFGLIIRLGVPIIVSQIMFAGLILILPMILMAIIVPVKGLAIAGGYFKMLFKFLIVKIVYGLYLAIVMALGTGISLGLMENEQVGLGLILLALIFGLAAVFAGTFFNALASELGGTSSGSAFNKARGVVRDASIVGNWWANYQKKKMMKKQQAEREQQKSKVGQVDPPPPPNYEKYETPEPTIVDGEIIEKPKQLGDSKKSLPESKKTEDESGGD